MFTSHAPLPQTSGPRSEALDLFCSLFDGSSVCIAQLDTSMSLIGGNAAFADAFGRTPDALPGRKFPDLMHSSCRQKLNQRLRSLTQGERVRFTDRVVASGDGVVFNAELTALAVADKGGTAESIIAVLEPEQGAGARRSSTGTLSKPLTKMDALVLEGVAAGMSTVQLASHLFLSRGGVEYHVSRLMRTFKAANRSALVSRAYSAGLFSVGIWPPAVIPDLVE
ncbi:PAS domain-containing protein [Actinomadura welshii]